GVIEAITDPAKQALVTAALREAGAARVWIGAPDMGQLATMPVVLRQSGDRAIVSVIDARRLLPQLDGDARVLLASNTGTIFYASPSLINAGSRAQQQLQMATNGHDAGVLISDASDASWVVAQAAGPGGIRVTVASRAPSSGELWMAALTRFALVA